MIAYLRCRIYGRRFLLKRGGDSIAQVIDIIRLVVEILGLVISVISLYLYNSKKKNS